MKVSRLNSYWDMYITSTVICNASEHKILKSLSYFMITGERRAIATIYILIKPCYLLYWFHSLTCLSRPSRERLRSPSLLLLSSSLQCFKHCFKIILNLSMIILSSVYCINVMCHLIALDSHVTGWTKRLVFQKYIPCSTPLETSNFSFQWYNVWKSWDEHMV